MAKDVEIAVSVTAAAIALSEGLSAEEASLMAAVFTQLGDTLTTIAEARAFSESRDAPPVKEERPV